jgi:hypothetical protein
MIGASASMVFDADRGVGRDRAVAPRVTVLALSLLCATAMLLDGCCVAIEVRLKNDSGHDVRVYSAHTEKTRVVRAGATEDLPHGSGALTITSSDGAVWNYADVQLVEGVCPDWCARYSFWRTLCGGGGLAWTLSLDRDGALFVVPPDGSKRTNARALQPRGFPLRPTPADVPMDGGRPDGAEGGT